jgi:hypothetical protein
VCDCDGHALTGVRPHGHRAEPIGGSRGRRRGSTKRLRRAIRDSAGRHSRRWDLLPKRVRDVRDVHLVSSTVSDVSASGALMEPGDWSRVSTHGCAFSCLEGTLPLHGNGATACYHQRAREDANEDEASWNQERETPAYSRKVRSGRERRPGRRLLDKLEVTGSSPVPPTPSRSPAPLRGAIMTSRRSPFDPVRDGRRRRSRHGG